MFSDFSGLSINAADPAAVEAYNDTVSAFLRFGRDTGKHLKTALQTDPEMVMANCLMGYFMHLMGSRALLPRADKSLAAASAQAEQANPREQAHIQALRAWCEGDLRAAGVIWESILVEYPRDMVALKMAQYVWFYLGLSEAMRDSVARVLPAWDESKPGYGYLLGMRAFGLEENGDYRAAESCGREAVAFNPEDAWAVHAVAHVMEMQDRHAEGIDWINTLEPHWQQANNFRYHLVWHRALMQFDGGHYDAVLEAYDKQLWDAESDEYLDLCNDASLLQRLEIVGVDVGSRWRDLAEKIHKRTNDHILTFIDAHFMMALAAGADDNAMAAEGLLTSQRGFADIASHNTTAALLAAVGLPLSEALLAYHQGDYDCTIDLLLPIRYQIKSIGGSHAQRDVFQQLLIEAAARAGRWKLARSLLIERTALKPNNPWSWRRYAQVLRQLGDVGAAARAETRADELVNSTGG